LRVKSAQIVAVGALATAVLATAVLASPVAAGATTLTGSGSSAAQPTMVELFKTYSSIHKNIHFKYLPDGGNAGVKDVQDHRSQFAIQGRPPLPSDAGTTYVKLFLGGVCIGVNRSNSLTDISMTDLKNVFLGVDTNWSQVSRSNLTTTIDPIGRNPASGLYTFFEQAVLDGATQTTTVRQETSDSLVQLGVVGDPNSIGYVGLGYSGPPMKKLDVDGIACDQSTIRAETYPLYDFNWGVIPTKNPNPAVVAFLRWVRTSKTAGEVVSKAGSVAIQR
jgi:phosphate transport system substrate-binding protein